MLENRKHRRLLYILVAGMWLLAAAMFTLKVYYLGFSLDHRMSAYYQVDGTVSFLPEAGKEVQVSLACPEPPPGYLFELDTDSCRFRREEQGGRCRLLLQVPGAGDERQSVVCRFRLVPGATPPDGGEVPAVPGRPVVADPVREAQQRLRQEIDPEGVLPPQESVARLLRCIGGMPPEEKKLLAGHNGAAGTVDAAIGVLYEFGLPARVVRYVSLEEKKNQQAPDVLLDVYYGGAWRLFNPGTGLEVGPDDLLILQRGDNSLYEVVNGGGSSIHFAVTRVPAGVEKMNRLRAGIVDRLSLFSLFELPSQEQNRFKWLALLPLAILLIVIARNVVGIQTMGTFMPVLIAMAFLEMKLLPGLANFILILAVGLAIRSWLSRLNLLMVPRISAVVVVVILLMQGISIVANIFHLNDFLGITFFPLIIIAWTIERASTTWEEDGARNTLKQLAASLGAAAVCYLVLSNAYLQYMLYTFYELNLIILGIILLLGTYTGYRLTELIRFRPLVEE